MPQKQLCADRFHYKIYNSGKFRNKNLSKEFVLCVFQSQYIYIYKNIFKPIKYHFILPDYTHLTHFIPILLEKVIISMESYDCPNFRDEIIPVLN